MRDRSSTPSLSGPPESLNALESRTLGGSDLGSTAPADELRLSRRATAYACRFCRSLAGSVRVASSRGLRLFGANFPGATGCDSVNSLAPPLRSP